MGARSDMQSSPSEEPGDHLQSTSAERDAELATEAGVLEEPKKRRINVMSKVSLGSPWLR